MSGEYTYTIPKYIADAFIAVYYYGANDEAYEMFASRWGALDLATFQRVALHGEGDDKLVALHALRNLEIPETTEILASFLESSRPLERAFSMMALAQRKDARALPVFYHLLNEEITFEKQLWAEQHSDEVEAQELVHIIGYCQEAVTALEQFDDPALPPLLQKALHQQWAVEQAFGHVIYGASYFDALAHALGHFGIFSVLDGLNLPLSHRYVAMVYLAIGALGHPMTEASHLADELLTDLTLQHWVAAFLAEHFGLSEASQQDCLTNFHHYQYTQVYYHEQANAGNEPFELYGWPEDQPNPNRGLPCSEDEDQSELEEQKDATEEEEGEEEPDEMDLIPWLEPDFVCVYKSHQGPVHSLAWSPNSRLLASASGDGTVQIWNPASGETLLTFRRHFESVNAVSWSPQGTYLASAGNDSLVYIWEATTGHAVTIYDKHRAWINQGLAWSPDGTRVASASWDHTVHIWDALTGQTLRVYHGHQAVVCSLSWSPDGKYLASGSGFPECQVHIWDAETGKLALIYHEHERDDKHARVFPKGTYPPAIEQRRGPSSLHFLSWSADGRLIASADSRLIFRVWDARTGQTVLSRNESWGPLAWSHDSRFVLTPASYQDAEVAQWSVAANSPVFIYRSACKPDLQTLSWSPDGQLIAASSEFGEVKVWKAVISQEDILS